MKRMRMTDVAFRSASELATMIQSKDISSRDLLDVYLERVDQHYQELNAVVMLDAVLDVEHRLGSDPSAWRWRDVHQAVFKHPHGQFWPLDWFSNRSVPVGGDNHTVNLGCFAGNSLSNVFAAPSCCMVVDLANVAHAFSMHTTGQSGRPSTPHSVDIPALG